MLAFLCGVIVGVVASVGIEFALCWVLVRKLSDGDCGLRDVVFDDTDIAVWAAKGSAIGKAESGDGDPSTHVGP